MVQGEINTAVTPSVQTATTPQTNTNHNNNNNNRVYENINGINMNTSDGEKKKKVGNYIISKTIGEGSFAKVRLGYHLTTQQMVAVKVINKREVLKRNYLRANLRREACMMQRMQHPHIIQLYEVMETENCYYIVMELIDGIEFVKYLSKKRSLDENETRDYIRQICSAVDHMHKAKVVHRDIKLQNFMLDQNHNLTIIDFGLSNCLDDREFLNTQCGSPAYAAPEIFAHQDYGPEVDIWSIGVNMYAMLAGKLPFKVENRSKNLAKLHACILKGFELPPFLSPDCQDLLCRLLDPSPNKRIKMSEIFAHPWFNYNSFPIELIPYKPVVDSKEIKMEIVQYLVHKHEYTENDVIDAIVNRKPVALKAIYYLIEKRLKQGLSFPDADYNNLLETKDNYKLSNNENSNPNSNNLNNINSSNTNINNNLTPSNAFINAGSANGLTKHNSQLLPKRHNNVQLAARSSSQKNVDFKSIFNNMNLNNNRTKENNPVNNNNNNNNNNDSNSPSPDFLAAAMSPVKTTQNNNNQQPSNQHIASASSIRTSRQTNYPDLLNRKQNGSNGSINNLNGSNTNVANNSQKYETQSRTSYAPSQTDYKIDRYYVPNTINNRMSPSDESYQPIVYYQPTDNRANLSSNLSNATNKLGTNGSIRSLPSSIYRGSPERGLPRSPERHNDYNNNNINNPNYRPTTSRVSSRPSISDGSEKSYKVTNYLTAKRSLTSADDPKLNLINNTNTNNIFKNRQLQMGKAKIDLDTQPIGKLYTNLNVGVNIKNLANYNLTKTMNLKQPATTTTYKLNSNTTQMNSLNSDALNRIKQNTSLIQRTLSPNNPNSYSTPTNLPNQNINKNTSTNANKTESNLLPRIRVNT